MFTDKKTIPNDPKIEGTRLAGASRGIPGATEALERGERNTALAKENRKLKDEVAKLSKFQDVLIKISSYFSKEEAAIQARRDEAKALYEKETDEAKARHDKTLFDVSIDEKVLERTGTLFDKEI